MGKSFKFVANHQGLYLAYNQNSLKPSFEKITKETFTGACVGSVAALLEAVFLRNALSKSFFKAPIIPMFRPSDLRCILLQREYEKDYENFFTIFIREKLKISISGYPERTGYCTDIKDVFKNLEQDTAMDQLLLLKLTFRLKTPEDNYMQEHMMCILKHEGYYLFFDPNSGVAIFNSKKNLKSWLVQEIREGALAYFDREENTKLRIYDNQSNPLKEGLLSVHSICMESFPYDHRNNYNTVYHACL